MSDSNASENMQEIFIRCTHFNFHIIACLRAKKALDMFQVSQLSGESSLIKRSQMVFEWMENNQSLRDIVLRVMEENEQQHVANLMKGVSNGLHIPLSKSRYNRLESITPKLMLIIRNDEELIAELRTKGAITEIDRQDITQVNKEYKRNWNLIEAILRRSDYAFDCLEQALRETLQDNVANYLNEGQVVSVHAKTTQPEKDEALAELLSRTILEESSEALPSGEKIFPPINGYSIHPVIAKPGQSIVFYFYCKAVDNMIKFTELFISGDLQNMMEVIMNRLLLKIDPEHTQQLKTRLSLDESEILAIEKFSGITDWMPVELEEAWSAIIYSAETQTEHKSEENDSRVSEKISAEIERMTSWSSAECSVGTEIEDVDSDVYASSRKLYWKQEKRTFYSNFESLLTEEEELLNYFLPEKTTSDKGWNWEQRRTTLSRRLESLIETQNYIVTSLIPSETSSAGGLRQAVQDIEDKLQQQQYLWKILKDQVLLELEESMPSAFKPNRRLHEVSYLRRGRQRGGRLPGKAISSTIVTIGHRLHEVRCIKLALKKSGELGLSGKGDIFSEMENLVVEVSKEKQQPRDFRTLLAQPIQYNPPLQLLSRNSRDEFFERYFSGRKQGQLESTDPNREDYYGALKRILEETQKENDTLKRLLEHKTPTVVLPVKFRSDPILVQTIRTKDAEERHKAIRGMAILDKELFVVSETSSEVEVYDSMKFSFSRRWNLKELIHTQDIGSCSRNHCLYIVDSKVIGQLKEILRVDPNGMLIKIWSTGDDFGWSLSVTDESNVILAVYNKHKLSEYSPDGQLIREINLMSVAEIRCPRHAIKLTNDQFVVSHGFGSFDPHQVIIVDANGKLKKSFGGTQGSTIVQLNSPVYLFVDENGFVLVVDHGNSRVLLLDTELKYRKEFLSKEKHELLFPQRILLDESNGQLFVADNDGKDGRILIFQLKTSN